MKTSFFILLFAAGFFVTGCSRSNDSISNSATQLAQNTAQAATAGTWKVSLFDERGNNETSDFTGYTFNFNSNGEVVAIKNGVSTIGHWNISSSSAKFNIDLGPKDNTNKPLGELTDDWRIISSSDAEIKLKDDNNEEFLTFSKI